MHRILVVATTTVNGRALEEQLREGRKDELAVHVVAPASGVTRTQWLTNVEDDARAEAEEAAGELAASVRDEALVETEVGDVDPIQAAEDALREFDADEIVVVVRPEEEASWLERRSLEDGFERFRLPVRYMVST